MSDDVRAIAVAMVEPRDGGAAVRVTVEPVDAERFEDGGDGDAIEYRGRLRAVAAGTAVERWCGGDDELSASGLGDAQPQFPTVFVAGAEAELWLELRVDAFVAQRPTARVDLVGRARVDLGRSGALRFALARAEPHAGPPFSPPGEVAAPVASGALAVPAAARSVAALPGTGIIVLASDGAAILATPGGVRSLAVPARSYTHVYTGGPCGTFAVAWDEPGRGYALSLFGPSSTSSVLHRERDQWFANAEGCFAGDGQLLLCSLGTPGLGVVEVPTARVRWQRRTWLYDGGLALAVSDANAITAGAGRWCAFDLATGADVQRGWLPTPSDSSATGVSAARFAWTQSCAAGAEPLGVIAWHDLDGAGHGQLAVRDALVDARVVVLASGRIVAVGASTWLVDPAAGRVVPIAPRVALPRRPVATAGAEGERLWTLDPARWYLDLG